MELAVKGMGLCVCVFGFVLFAVVFLIIKVNNVMQAKFSHQIVKIWDTFPLWALFSPESLSLLIAHTLYLVGHLETSISVLLALCFVC